MDISYKRQWETRGSRRRAVPAEAPTSYYNLPVIHKAHWGWLVIIYFFLGGISAGSYVIATVADLFGGPDARRIRQVGRYLALGALLPSPVLLILDLGRPERFYRMLRVLKLRSPMSVGTWGLTIFGGFCGLSALIQTAEDGLFGSFTLPRRFLLALPSKPIGVLGTLFGFLVGGYTGVLLAATAVPLWAKNYLLLGPLFLTSAMSTASAAIVLVLVSIRSTSHRTLKRLERLDLIAIVLELVLLLAAKANLGPIIARPLQVGKLARVYRWGVLGAGITLPLTLLSVTMLWRKAPARLLGALSSLLVLVGGLLLRYVMVEAGHASADDPQATFAFARKP
ncbi:MAG: polysulfide reductase NrfD [Herpetosiphonaceae bacterium]|nr:polysulfide reductase NrfD [Herpetosiphonaceae bacterium]